MRSFISIARVHALMFGLVTATALTGCSDAVEPTEDPPVLLGLSASSVQVGHGINFIGSNFIDASDGRTIMRFDGVFHGTTQDYPVENYDVRTMTVAKNEVSWPYFGHFRVPFVPTGDEIGTFEGTVTPLNTLLDGTEIAGEPINVSLTILPSIIVKKLQPVVTNKDTPCERPSIRMLGGYAYDIEVETIGFPANSLAMRISGEPGDGGERAIFAPMQSMAHGGARAIMGGVDRQFTVAMVPDDATNYIVNLRLTATGPNQEALSVYYPLPVHRPIALIPRGAARLAEVEQAVPVSGCMAGGINGNNVRYEETQSETRQRQIQYNWNTDWSNDKSSTESVTTDWSNGVNTSLTMGGEFNWGTNFNENVNNSAGARGSLGGGILPAGVDVNYERGWGHTKGGQEGNSLSWSLTGGGDARYGETDNVSTTLSNRVGGSNGVSEFYDVSSTTSVTNAITADVIPNMYGVWFRQVTRWTHPAAVVEFDLCGDPHTVADVEIADYQWAVSLGQGTECSDVKIPFHEAACYLGC